MEANDVRVFISYVHEAHNANWMKRLLPALTFRNASLAYVWHDQELKPGDIWERDIRAELERMDIFVPLVSLEFFESRFICEVELAEAEKRARKQGIKVIPVQLWPLDLKKEHPFLGQFNPLPAWDRACSHYLTHDGEYQTVHQPVREGLRSAIEEVRTWRRGAR